MIIILSWLILINNTCLKLRELFVCIFKSYLYEIKISNLFWFYNFNVLHMVYVYIFYFIIIYYILFKNSYIFWDIVNLIIIYLLLRK